MKMPTHLALNAYHRAVGNLGFGRSIHRDARRKTTGVAAHDLDAADGLAPWPLPHGIQALLSQRRIAYP